MKKIVAFIASIVLFVGFSSIATASSYNPCEPVVKCTPKPKYKWVTKCKTVCKTRWVTKYKWEYRTKNVTSYKTECRTKVCNRR